MASFNSSVTQVPLMDLSSSLCWQGVFCKVSTQDLQRGNISLPLHRYGKTGKKSPRGGITLHLMMPK